MDFQIAILPGDGVGPEVTKEATRVLDAVGTRFRHSFRYKEGLVGGCAIDAQGLALPAQSLNICKGSHAVILGAVGGPKWDDPKASVRPEDGLLALRKGLGLFVNLRPIKTYPSLIDFGPIKPEVLEGTEMVVLRELTGGLYFARPKRRWTSAHGRRGVDTLRYSEREIERIVRVGFELAKARRKKLTSVDKANVLESSRLWREIAAEVAEDYPEVTLENMLVDTCAMQLISNPRRFDVIVTENTFGDILTDEAAVLGGSMGMLPSASLGAVPTTTGRRRRVLGLYEPIHGSAPDIAGQGKANPLASILSIALMLRYSLFLQDEANVVEKAVSDVLDAGYRTADIASGISGIPTPLSTSEMGKIVVDHLMD